MGIGKCFKMAFDSIITSKMRAFLTMLGIIIGIAAVIILVSLMNGLTGQMTSMFEEMGTTTITANINPRAATRTIEPEDVWELVEANPELLSDASPTVSLGGILKAGSGDDSISVSATGVAENYSELKMLAVEHGRFLQYIDIEREMYVCVIGTYISDMMFGSAQAALNQTVKLNGVAFKVVGVLQEQEDSSSSSSDNCMYIPYTRAAKMSRSNTISNYIIVAADEGVVTQAVEVIEALFLKKIGDEDYYNVTSMLSMIDNMTSMTDSMGTVLIAIAAISLLVGGIGIMNIMLVSVTERTREIGIRKSLGARNKHIMSQFVIEAATVSCIGGIIGIILGSIVSVIGGKILNMEVVPSAASIIISFGVSAGIGIVFGFLPARKAALLNPIDALRHE